ncbi:MAG: hypothetical protein IIC78_13140 [Chloroflexi bacterium]|nr:hypothetical protein [Chloroflexota bacterium]
MAHGHWDNLISLIEKAKKNRALSETLRTGTPREVTRVLQEAGLSMDDLGEIFTDLGYIADRSSLQWWSPLK